MGGENSRAVRAFVVHGFTEPGGDRLFLTGRTEAGPSFAAAVSRWRPFLPVPVPELDKFRGIIGQVSFSIEEKEFESFDGRDRLKICRFFHHDDFRRAVEACRRADFPLAGGSLKIPDQFFLERRIKGPVLIEGASRRGRRAGLVFNEPEISPLDDSAPAQKLIAASVDIETDEETRAITAIAIVWRRADSGGAGSLVRIVPPPGKGGAALGSAAALGSGAAPACTRHRDEASLLRAFLSDISAIDPDVLTGWNFLDFDFPRLAERCAACRIPFTPGRGAGEAKYFPASGRASAAAFVPGRVVVDALRVVRSGPERFAAYDLETVARAVLGEGKLIAERGEEKLKHIENLYTASPEKFAEYCRKDAVLVLDILEKTGLLSLTLERAILTGVSLDRAWTSVLSFERVYGLELLQRGVMPPPERAGAGVSGAAGGTILECESGLFDNVAVFDFRSLYPTIIRTFNIDPLSHARAGEGPWHAAPNGAEFARAPGILPGLIGEYFAERKKALASGNGTAAHVYKILMNSFYGVLGTGACRYGRTELAGAITSFARKWLYLCRDWFTARGYRVLYGDTDSLFVLTGLEEGAGYGDFAGLCTRLAAEANGLLQERIREEYGLDSYLELRFEKAYRRFLIPPLRSGGGRGRAKGYGGLLLTEDGGEEIEVKGMEAVRRDATPLGRRLQLELLALVFGGCGQEEFAAVVEKNIALLKAGRLDSELVYRKRLRRPPEAYTASTPPQVKAARLLGWKGRRGAVDYLWTLSGPEPESALRSPLDYGHYIDSQILPVARSIAEAAGFALFRPHPGTGQGELF